MNHYPFRAPFLLLVLIALLSFGCATESATDMPDAEPTKNEAFASLEPGWNTFEPGGETTCSDGSTFRFFARPGNPEKLLVYLMGGGGCWTGATCDRDLQPTYTIQAPEQLIEAKAGEPRPERAMNGIFDYTRPENPFRDYSAVFIPYCTGDVHLGDNTLSYDAPATDEHEAHAVEVHHRGRKNVAAALDWAYETFDAPKQIFVTGSSAGSIPSPLYAYEIKNHYPNARVTQLGDGSGGYRRLPGASLPHTQWGTLDTIKHIPYFAEMTDDQLRYEDLYIAAAKAHPDVQFAQFDNAEDAVQLRFLSITSPDVAGLQDLLDKNRLDITNEVANFTAYTAPGDGHTILGTGKLYTESVGGVTFLDWLTRLAEGEAVETVHCGEACS